MPQILPRQPDNPIRSLRDFASRVGVPLEALTSLAQRIDGRNGRYSEFPVSKRGRPHIVRQVRNPQHELKDVLRRINRRILAPLLDLRVAHGGIKGRSPRTNAQKHLGKNLVVTIDAKKFFPTLRPKVVYRYFRRRLGYGRDVASLLTRLLTLEGSIPLGAPTSMSLANLLLQEPVDSVAASAARNRGLSITRFVDDIAFSGDDSRSVINDVAKALSRCGLRTHRYRPGRPSKLRIMPSSGAQRVTGYIVNNALGPTIPRAAREAIRLAIFNLSYEVSGVEREKTARSLSGRIAQIRRLHPGHAARLTTQLERAQLA